MTPNAVFYVFAAILYLAAACGIYRSLRSPDPSIQIWMRPAVAAGLIVQSVLIYEAFFLHGTPHFGLALALSVTLFTCTLILLIESFFSRTGAMLMCVLPAAAISMLLPLFLPGSALPPQTAILSFRLHLLFAIFAYSLMTMALIQALLLSAAHARLRDKRLGELSEEGAVSFLEHLPSVVEMEKMLFRLLWIGFAFLTVAIVCGFISTAEIFGSPWRADHKMAVTLLAWLIFAFLLGGHYFLGWRGRFAARWTVVGFCVLMLAYIGMRLVVEVGA